ncbi:MULTISPECIES: aldo/keto reductase [Paenibacillus]|uniref:Aldo/keto reductase n=1 Tax=Paenibacillus xylanilyticus TaxID=248903 RepID=A0A7Y6EXM2_9BACL|nr:aldo/keto reductase [Paenibacillus xylanilyticus]NUU79016.1 aldo/keto reductase [Paenibacillus xylanilyticus]
MNRHYTQLRNGVQMPWIGLGVWTPERDDATEAIKQALEMGYRSIDTASAYENETQVGRAVAESGIPREDMFITTKVANGDQGYDSTLHAFESSMEKLQLDYLDLYLIHWPVEGKSLDTWRALEHLYRQKRVRAIGVSNFQINDLEGLLSVAEVVPMVNQIEFHPNLTHMELRVFCKQHQIQMEAWSPLMKGQLSGNETLESIASKHGKTVAQVILRWDIQSGFVTIPKSFNATRLLENISIFDFTLTEEEMSSIDLLNKNEKLPKPDMSKFRSRS